MGPKRRLSDGRIEAQKQTPRTLAAAGLSRRRLAWLLALLVGLLFLVLPIVQALFPEMRDVARQLPVAFDASWSPGALAVGHRGFGNDCKTCHETPGVPVRDRVCSNCHQDVGDHVANVAMQKAVFGETRCADCHRDHRGAQGLAHASGASCVDCHADLQARAPETTLPNAADFGTRHPALRVALLNTPDGSAVTRVSEDDQAHLVEHSGLKFPHDVHLAREGVKSPDAVAGAKGLVHLDCSNCHEPDGTGVGFKQVSMQAHCAQCHRLQFEPEVTARQVPHGSERLVMTTLREFYASVALGTTPRDAAPADDRLRRPGEAPSSPSHGTTARWANAQAMAAATDLFEVRVCTTCHTVKRVVSVADAAKDPRSVPWKIGAVRLSRKWMPAARFQHDRHAAVACADCHQAAASHRAEDVLMPTIAECRTCHVGPEPQRNKVASDCALCHGFHKHRTMPPSNDDKSPGLEMRIDRMLERIKHLTKAAL